MKTVCVIPARYGSTRLPGKPLKDICGQPMLAWVYAAAKNVNHFEHVVVATDSEAIFDECIKRKFDVIMTNSDHPTAIHRLGEVSKKIKADYYVQLNGDEPLIKSDTIRQILPTDEEFHKIWGMNIITPINNPVELMDTSNIKVLFDSYMKCIYMSRNVVPCPYKTLNFKYYKHVGVIGYTLQMIEFYEASKPGMLEQIEGIDLLRFIDYDKFMKLRIIENCETLSVDTEKDLEEVRKRIAFRTK